MQQFAGGSILSMGFSNLGYEHDVLYTRSGEIFSGEWLYKLSKNSVTYADGMSYRKLLFSVDPKYRNKLIYDLFPKTIFKESYVYSSYTNTFNGISFRAFSNSVLTYNFPIEFLEDNKNKIYSNGGSNIFK